MKLRTYSVLGVPCGFRMVSSFSEKEEIKAAGFKWDPGQKNWFTKDFTVAAKMITVADDEASHWLQVGSFPDLKGRPPGMCQKAWDARQKYEEKISPFDLGGNLAAHARGIGEDVEGFFARQEARLNASDRG